MSKVEEKFRKIEEIFTKLSLKNKEELENAKIRPIHEKYSWAQNGITAFIAGMGSGKSYNCLKLIAKQEVLFNELFYETVALCSINILYYTGPDAITIEIGKKLYFIEVTHTQANTALRRWRDS